MAIRIVTKKVLIRNKPYRKIISIDMLPKEDLPDEYTRQGPCIWNEVRYEHGLGLKTGASGQRLFPEFPYTPLPNQMIRWELKAPIAEQTFQDLLKFIRTCGNRLMHINRELRSRYPDFDGREETIVI